MAVTGMRPIHVSFSFAVGILGAAYWPTLPNSSVLVGLFLAGVACLLWQQRLAGWLLFGICYGCGWGHYSLSHQLPDALTPSDHIVVGKVVGLPQRDGDRVRFNLKLLESKTATQLKQLRLSWYRTNQELEPGQIWQLEVRLRRPRGSVNPGGFDYQAWLLGQGVSATGYVLDRSENTLLGSQHSMDHWRYQLRQSISASATSVETAALISALTIGDRSLIPTPLWQRLSQLGLVHLLVVSGLHIGFVTAIGYGLGAAASRIGLLCGMALNSRYSGALTALLAAVVYAAMAGFSLPTQRALVMSAAVLTALLANRHISMSTCFGLALAAVALLDPLAASSVGFWLSFGAVAGLLWLLPKAHRDSRWRQLLRVQWLVFLLMLLPLVFWQLPVAWLAPVVNSLAIPWVGFLILPCCFAGMITAPLSSSLADLCWAIADWQLQLFLALTQSVVPPDWIPPHPPWALSGAAGWLMVAVVGLFLLPRGVPGRYLCLPLLLTLFWLPGTNPYPLSLTVLDVGQGLAAVVRTENHTLIYDTGPAYGEQFDAGSVVVAPFLRKQGIAGVDRLVVSHDDNDHAGGSEGLVALFPPRDWLAGEPGGERTSAARPCVAGESWHWDGIEFRFIHPAERSTESGNNSSCVLLVSYRDQVILLPGDIETAVEHKLREELSVLPAGVSVLVAPHHGSKTSSSSAFVSATKPRHVVFSAGYRHHFGHPNPKVVARYRAVRAQLWNTAEQGAIQFDWDHQGSLHVSTARSDERRYWY